MSAFSPESSRRSSPWAKLHYRFVIVGEGSERAWLAEHMQQAELPGVLRGNALSRAYANLDLFVFPSHTDAFGNVVQEALASGVPAVARGRRA